MFEEKYETNTDTCILDFLGVIFGFIVVLGKFTHAFLNPEGAHLEVFRKIPAFYNFAHFLAKHLWHSSFSVKLAMMKQNNVTYFL